MRQYRLGTRKSWVVGALVATTTACSAASEAPSEPFQNLPELQAVTPTELQGVAGKAIGPAPTVKVVDGNGKPIAGRSVLFSVVQGGGTIASAAPFTDANGIASAAWTLGTIVQHNRLTAHAEGIGAVTFSATAAPGPIARLEAFRFTDGDVGAAGVAMQPLTAKAVDEFGNGVRGVRVTFAVASGGGTIADSVAVTDHDGVARSGWWTLGSLGENSAIATADGVAPVTFTATAIPPGGFSAGTYTLESIRLGSLPLFRHESTLVVHENGDFVVTIDLSSGRIIGRGTYTKLTGSLVFKYSNDFLEALEEKLAYSPWAAFPGSDRGFISDNAIVIQRCWTEDCYESAWTYRKVMP